MKRNLKKAVIQLTLSYDEASNLASILLSDASKSARKRKEYQLEKKKDGNTKSIIALMKRIEKMEDDIAKRIYTLIS